ncbi:MAG: family 78 glycoside hydrolase catalytic domain, partial [Candidatus Methylacidiphilales bacterium]
MSDHSPSSQADKACSIAAPSRLRCEYEINPLGVQTRNPRLSWELNGSSESGRGAAAAAWQIVATRSPRELDLSVRELDFESGTTGIQPALLWDSGEVASTETHAIYEGEIARVWWKVRVWDQAGRVSDWSEPASFEFGILNHTNSDWITAGDREAAPYFRCEFPVPLKVKRARVFFSGLGFGELYINGLRVSEDQLSPGWTDYDEREYRDLLYPYDDSGRKRILYRVYDVTSLVHKGSNAVGCILGNGMHQQRVRTIEGKMWYGAPRFKFDLYLTLEDGSVRIVESCPPTRNHWHDVPGASSASGSMANPEHFPSAVESGWRWTEGPITFNNIFTGEIYDARQALPANWCQPGFNASGWKHVELAPEPRGSKDNYQSQICPSDTIVATLQPVASREPAPGVHVVDFGRVISGWLRISPTGPAGTRIVLRFSENADEGGLPNFRSAGGDHIQQDEFILAGTGAPETWQPRFTWHAFRYAEITGWPVETSGAPSSINVEAQVVYVNTPSTAEFECSNPLINRIVTLFRDTQLANQHIGIISDCPHRERLGYTGDAQITAEAVMWNFDVASLYSKWIDDIFDAQNTKSGFVPHTVPFYGGGGGPGWGSACIIIPWTYYQFYGDERVLSKNYAGMVAWLEYLKRHTDERGLVTHEEPGSWCLGDWAFPSISPENTEKRPNVAIELVNTYYYGECAALLERIATALGKTADAEHFAAELAQIRHNFHAAFYDPATGSYGEGIGGSNAFALLLDAGSTEIVTPDEEEISETPERIR